MQFAVNSINELDKEITMGCFKYMLACLLLVVSCQSHALFMPEGFKVNTDDAESDGGCGVLVIQRDAVL